MAVYVTETGVIPNNEILMPDDGSPSKLCKFTSEEAITTGEKFLEKFSDCISNKNWDEVRKYLNPKLYGTRELSHIIDGKVMARTILLLIEDANDAPINITILALKCVGNSCFGKYKYQRYPIDERDPDRYLKKVYTAIVNGTINLEEDLQHPDAYPFKTHFPFDGACTWAGDKLVHYAKEKRLSSDEEDIVRLCMQFLCNVISFASKVFGVTRYKNTSMVHGYNLCVENKDDDNKESKKDHNSIDDKANNLNEKDKEKKESEVHNRIPDCLRNPSVREALLDYFTSESAAICKVTSALIYNMIDEAPADFLTVPEKIKLCSRLLIPIRAGNDCALEIAFRILRQPDMLKTAYEELPLEDVSYLLEAMYNEISDGINREDEEATSLISRDMTKYISERFRTKSDIILQTADKYLEGVDPRDIGILLDLLGVLTCEGSDKQKMMQNDKELLITCINLLKSVHELGKKSDNYFTPIQKLSAMIPNARKDVSGDAGKVTRDELYSHPSFGFKVKLIRVIGNMAYHDKECQDLIRETDAIPLLLDCCNMDARNPLIMQWVILGIRNICERNPGSQEVLHRCKRIGVIDNALINEMGLTLCENADGKSIGIVPLPQVSKPES